MKSSCLPTITISDNSWRRKVWASDKSIGLGSSFVTTFESIIVKARLMGSLMPYLNTLSKVQRKTRPSALRISRSCTVCSPCWPKYLAFQLTWTNFFFSIRSSYTEQLFFPGWTSSETHCKPNWMRKSLIKLVSVLYVWDFRSYKKQTWRPKKSELQSCRKDRKRSTGFSTTKSSLICRKLFVLSSSASTMMIY